MATALAHDANADLFKAHWKNTRAICEAVENLKTIRFLAGRCNIGIPTAARHYSMWQTAGIPLKSSPYNNIDVMAFCLQLNMPVSKFYQRCNKQMRNCKDLSSVVEVQTLAKR